ncbi:hypothetical protein [Mesorhizobium sp. M0118]|uniref:hypothetical protein n=1 Tax=Mesorhizobium sp. M0118 TaxID=2956884 RepID=UPI00333CD31A
MGWKLATRDEEVRDQLVQWQFLTPWTCWSSLILLVRNVIKVIGLMRGEPSELRIMLTSLFDRADFAQGSHIVSELLISGSIVGLVKNPWRGEEAAVVGVMHDGSRRRLTIGEMQEPKERTTCMELRTASSASEPRPLPRIIQPAT